MKKMKNIKFIIGLCLTILVFTSCEKDNNEFGDIVAPANLEVAVEVVGQDDSNPYGDGSGVVNFTATANGAVSYKFIIDGIEDVVPSGIFAKSFFTVGTNTYDVTVLAYGVAGVSTSTTFTVEVLTTYTPPADLIEALTAGSSRTWRVKSEVPQHFGLGPVGGSVPCEWYGAGPEEKAGLGSYDDRWTFNIDGTVTHTTNGDIFGRTAQVYASLGDNGTGATDGADILNYQYGDYTENWNIIDPGQLSIALTGEAFFTYFTGGDHVYEIWDYNANELYLRTVDGASEFTWWTILIAE